MGVIFQNFRFSLMIKPTSLLQHVCLDAPLLPPIRVGSVCPSRNHGKVKLIISKTIFIRNHTYRIFSLVISSLVFLQFFHVKYAHSSHQLSPFVMTSAQPIAWIKLLSFHHTPTGFTHSQCWHPFYIYVMTMMPSHFFTSCRWVL